ncbi:MAG TPA: hypothetical protein VIG66_09220 [Noviherbaspirillum sp.]
MPAALQSALAGTAPEPFSSSSTASFEPRRAQTKHALQSVPRTDIERTRADRKRQLILKGRLLRAHLMHASQPLAGTLTTGESAFKIASRIRQHPEWLAAGLAAVLLLQPRRISGWLRDARHGLRMSQQLLPLLSVLRR